MKAFKFTLQSLLKVKTMLEKQAMAELAAAEQRLNQERKQLEACRESMAVQRQVYIRSLERGELTPSDMGAWSIGFRAVRERITKQEKRVADAEADRRKAQRKVIELMKERKMLEKLREKQLEEYRQAAKAEDAVAVDEFVSSKIHRSD